MHGHKLNVVQQFWNALAADLLVEKIQRIFLEVSANFLFHQMFSGIKMMSDIHCGERFTSQNWYQRSCIFICPTGIRVDLN